jgi:predicted dehydrogenase
MELVALCDTWEERLQNLGRDLGVATYTDYDKFLEHDMDAVILANYFHQHAPFAVKALEADKHVMSETSACFTLAEGVALVEAVEKSGKIYMFAENYPYMLFNQEMRRLYQSGLIGEFKYGEGEYVHPIDPDYFNRISPGANHWRNWIPATYYNTHALGPVMCITDTWPVKVNGFVVPYDPDDRMHCGLTTRRSDMASSILVRMDNGAVVKLLQVSLRGEGIWVRIHGNKGAMENLRHGDRQMVYVRRHRFDIPEGEEPEQTYRPEFPKEHARALEAGHGGGDYFVIYHFAEAIRRGEQPYLNVYRGVAMSIVGILAYRSALQDSNTVDVPDFRNTEVRGDYAKDDWNPDPAQRKEGHPWPSVLGDIQPPEEGVAYARKVWRDTGYTGE